MKYDVFISYRREGGYETAKQGINHQQQQMQQMQQRMQQQQNNQLQ
ncbi:MAG: hypothetical protein IJY98_00590 [Bacteroidaceae bacterium]|nr:hypothetical protein [Bacteroidaceae bacterium]